MKPMEIMNALNGVDETMIAAAARPAAHRFPLRRALLLAAALVLTMSITISALAVGNVGIAYDLLYRISPQIAQFLKPVNLSCIDQGIEFRVISAEIDGDTAYAYVGIKDLEGDRIDATCDPFDTINIRGTFDQEGTCSFVSFDEAEREATFLVMMRRRDGQPIDRQKVTITLSEILSDRREWEGEIPGFTADMIDRQPTFETIPENTIRGYGERTESEYRIAQRLVPDMEPIELLPGITFTGAAYENGQLDVQMLFKRIRETDNHGFFYLIDEQGQTVYPLGETSYWTYPNASGALGTNTDSFDEIVFAIREEELTRVKFCAQVFSSSKLTRGYWSVTFPLADS